MLKFLDRLERWMDHVPSRLSNLSLLDVALVLVWSSLILISFAVVFTLITSLQ